MRQRKIPDKGYKTYGCVEAKGNRVDYRTAGRTGKFWWKLFPAGSALHLLEGFAGLSTPFMRSGQKSFD